MHSALAVVLVGCVAAVSAVTLVKGPIDGVADLYRDMYVDNGVYAHGRGVNKNQNNNLKTHHIGIQDQDQDGIDERFNGQQPKGGVLHYTFKPDFDALIDPRNMYADWRWAKTSPNNETVADNGTFVRDCSKNSIELVSIPYTAWVPQDNTRVPPIADSNEALLVNKQNISVLPGQKLAVNLVFSCKIFNNEDHPLAVNKQSVSKPEDDPTLSSCGYGIMSYDESALVFAIAATNKGIWAVYQRNRYELFSHPERNQREFTIFKKLATRESAHEPIDATIVYDHVENKVDFMLSGKVVHTIGELGTITQAIKEDKAYADIYNSQREDLQRVEPQDFQVALGLLSFPDTIDPNNPSNPPLRTVKLTTDPNYYDVDAKFEDNENQKINSIWGQGAEMTLISIDIKLEGTATGAAKPNAANNVVVGGRRHTHGGRRAGRIYSVDSQDENQEEVEGEEKTEENPNQQ